jgi:hypothetical protein
MVANNWSSVGHQSAMLAPCAPVAAPMATRAYCRRQLLANAAHCPASPRSRVLACDLHGSRSQGQFWARFGFPLERLRCGLCRISCADCPDRLRLRAV